MLFLLPYKLNIDQVEFSTPTRKPTQLIGLHTAQTVEEVLRDHPLDRKY